MECGVQGLALGLGFTVQGSQTPAKIQKVDPLMGGPYKVPYKAPNYGI